MMNFGKLLKNKLYVKYNICIYIFEYIRVFNWFSNWIEKKIDELKLYGRSK